MARKKLGGSLKKEQIDKAIEVLSNQSPRRDFILLLGHYENLLKYGIKDAFINPVDEGLVIIANDKEVI